MLRHNASDFIAQIRRMPGTLVERWREGAVEIGVQSYGEILRKTDDSGAVDTGALRAENVIEQEGRFLYENPDRVGPDRALPSQKARGEPPLIDAPSLDDVRGALEAGLAPGPFRFANRRSYAEFLEFGTSRMEPRQIYTTARDATEAIVERVAKAVSERGLE